MRRTWWICLVLLASTVEAIAETRQTTVAVTLRKRPGEKSLAVVALPAGTTVEVIREEGRWLLVRANNAEGYLTRTTVTEPTAPPGTPVATTWGAIRTGGTAGEPKVSELFVEVIAPTTVVRATPAADGARVGDLARGTRIAVLDAATHPGWVHGRAAVGSMEGWIARGTVADSASAVTLVTEDVKGVPTGSTFRRRPPAAHALRIEAGVGYRSLGMDLTSNADGGLTNYLVDADAVATELRVMSTIGLGARWFAAVDGTVQAAMASPGLDYPGPTSAPGKIPFRTLATELGGRFGVRASDVFAIAVRVAGHYDAFLPRDVDNAGLLPRERLLGLVAGARVDVVPPTSPFSAALRLDVLAFGARAQTPGLEDGTASTTHGAWGGMTLRFALTPRWALFGDYTLGRTTTAWTGMSIRQPGVTSARRVDTGQFVQLGIGAEL
ncbi:MAG: SH3 domain-containing protein [Proteobacteria bacterium]|nr:SH3 domain-containing protein [Pseudomonadota bacterium]